MSSRPLPVAATAGDAPAALAAFLRGVERRGAVLAELQCGDAATGDAALIQTMRGFRAAAATLPMNGWPQAFWSLLLAQPGLQRRTPVAIAMEATDALAELGVGPRAALLLRLAAGLSEPEAAAALGVAQPTYRLALRRALPSHADGRADPQAWQRLREQVHRRIKTLPPERLERLARAREAALRGEPAIGGDAPAPAAAPRPRRLLAWLWSLLGACVLAFAATFWWPGGGSDGGARDSRVDSEPLPPADTAAARYGADAAAVGHRDFALLADPAAEAVAEEADFYSWLARAQADGGGNASAALAAADPGAAGAPAGAALAAAVDGNGGPHAAAAVGGGHESEAFDAPR